MAFVWAAIGPIHITKNWTLRQNVKNAIMEIDNFWEKTVMSIYFLCVCRLPEGSTEQPCDKQASQSLVCREVFFDEEGDDLVLALDAFIQLRIA